MFQTGKNEAAKMDCDVEDKLPKTHQQESNISNENANEISGEDFSKSATKYRCNPCEKEFSLKGTWKRHISSMHSETPRQKLKLICPHCNREYSSEYLSENLKRKHPS